MNKRQAKKQYKKIHGHNPPKTAVTKYTPEEMEAMKVYNLTQEDIERIGNGLRDAFAEMFKALQRVAESMARVFEDMGKEIQQTSYRDRGAAGGSGQNPVRKEKEVQEKRVESIREVDFSGLKVPFVAVYGHPDDFPDKYVARIYELDRATDTIMVKETLEEIEMDIKEHTAMTFIPRGTADVPSLVGVWM